jgi:NAD(P)H-dependent flavin oxidoreductase YrpB (nitropropane dioxygenase family)
MTQSSPTRDGLANLLRRRIVVAPMAGGPTTAGLVIAAARAGAFGFLAAGYKTPAAMAAEIAAVRAATAEPFGVNVFVPGAPYPDSRALAGYLDSLGPELGDASWDDDGFDGKIAALLADPPAVTSFTFGCPAAGVIGALQDAGSAVAVTVTSPAEAAQAAEAGADGLCVQGYEAGATVTRAFSGRPARGLVNAFIVEHADAPPAYPEINNATRPLRAAAAARGDTERMSLWAGQGYRLAAELPAAEIIERLRG